MSQARAGLASRFLNKPLAIRADHAGTIVASLTSPVAAYGDGNKTTRDDRPYEVDRGVAIIPVKGVLMSRAPSWAYWYFDNFAAYDRIAAATLRAVQDDEVKAVAFDIDSPGGEVSGCFDLVDAIYNLRGEKPMWAILAENAYSAGYAIASACDHVTVPRTGGVGSVGCIMLHTDISRWLEEDGVTVTLIQYGDRKADGTDVRPLSKEARERFQDDIDTMGELFTSIVARNRNLTVGKVRRTEAATFLGAQGVEIGFADAVMSPDAAFITLLDTLGS